MADQIKGPPKLIIPSYTATTHSSRRIKDENWADLDGN